MATTSKNMTFDVNLLPTTTNDHNLGSSSLKWNLYVNQINGSTPTLTDTQVTQSAATTASGAYPILLAYSTATTAVTNTVNKTSTLTYNPNTKALVTGGTVDGYTLAAASAKGVTDNSSNADVTSSDTNLITGRTLYYQLAKKGYTTNTGTVTSITPGNGLINGTSGTSQTAITGSGTISIKAAGVTNAMLANSSITIGNATINLGDSVSLDDLGLNYLPLTGGTVTGNITTKYSTWDVTTNPSENKNVDPYYVYDANNKSIVFHRVHHYATGRMGYELGVRRQGSATTTDTLWNAMGLWVENDGTRMVSFTDPAVWRSGLGLGSMATEAASTYMPKSGGTFTGAVYLMNSRIYDANGYPGLVFSDASTGDVFATMNYDAKNAATHRFYFTQKYAKAESYGEIYKLPNATSGLTANKWYDILTTKSAVTVAQGGTGATDAATARTNLGLDSTYLKLSGGTLTGSIRFPYSIAHDTNGYPGLGFSDSATNSAYGIINYDAKNASTHRFYFTQRYTAGATYGDIYTLPNATSGLTANAWYSILTSKNAVTVAQGGTGATTFTSGAALIGNGTGAITTRSILNNTSTTYVGTGTDLITKNTLAYWNGAYNSSNASNITKVGTITSGTWNGTKIAKQYVDFYMGGITADDTTITLPVASKTYLIITGHNSTGNYNTMFLYRAGSSTPFWKIWESSAPTSSLSGYTMIGNVGWKANNATLTARCATSASINCYAIMLG